METTVITTTCGIIYSRQFEWLMWKSGWAANKIEGRVEQFLCDFKQCPQCLWQVTETWIAGTTAPLCWLAFLAVFSPDAPHPQRLQIFQLQPRRRKWGRFSFQQPGVVSGGSYLADVTGDSSDSQRTESLMGPCNRVQDCWPVFAPFNAWLRRQC